MNPENIRLINESLSYLDGYMAEASKHPPFDIRPVSELMSIIKFHLAVIQREINGSNN